jgi:hypothetical protein
MALRRTYTLTNSGLLSVIDEHNGKLTDHYAAPSSPAFGLVAAELYVSEDGTHTLAPNGAGAASVRACIELLLLLQEDLSMNPTDPRAF